MERKEEIHEKGFNLFSRPQLSAPDEYNSIKVDVKTLEDATLKLGIYQKINPNLGSKAYVLNALYRRDLEKLREISDFFFRTNGIYQRICAYFATMYRYDWYVVPEVYSDKVNTNKVTSDFYETLRYLDDSYIKKICGEIALNVIKYGCYYGYVVEAKEGFVLQELPIKYCRTRYNRGPLPAIEFNLRYFDDNFTDPVYR